MIGRSIDGHSHKRNNYFNTRFKCLASSVLVAIVIALVTDIDTPRAGLISLDQRQLLELNEMLQGSSTSTTP